jgi:hypothetical protein
LGECEKRSRGKIRYGEGMILPLILGHYLQEKKREKRKENVPVTRYWRECEYVNLMLITVVCDVT